MGNPSRISRVSTVPTPLFSPFIPLNARVSENLNVKYFLRLPAMQCKRLGESSFLSLSVSHILDILKPVIIDAFRYSRLDSYINAPGLDSKAALKIKLDDYGFIYENARFSEVCLIDSRKGISTPML